MTQYIKPHPPGMTDNAAIGFVIGDTWLDVSVQPSDLYVLVNISRIDAVWRKTSFSDSGGGGGGGSTNVPIGALAFGDGLEPAGVTGDPDGIIYDDEDQALVFPNLWSIDFTDSIGGSAGFIADVDELTFVTTNTASEPVLAIQIDMNNASPAVNVLIPLDMTAAFGDSAFIYFPAPDGTTGGFNFEYDADAQGTLTLNDDLGNTYFRFNTLDTTITPNGPTISMGVPLNCLLGDPIFGLTTEDNRYFPTVTTQTYTIIQFANTTRQFSELVIQLASGTCTVTFKINSVSITGMTNIAVTSVQGFHAGVNGVDNVLSAGDKLTMVVTAASTPVDLSFSLPGLTQ
jgi:hypothetical protein